MLDQMMAAARRVGWMARFMQRHNLWEGMVWGISQLLGWFGIVYGIAGNGAFTGPSLVVLRSVLNPVGGLRLFGIIMVIVASMLIVVSFYRGRAARIALRSCFVMFLVLFWFSISGWVETHTVPPGLGIWAFGAIASVWLAVKTPEPERLGGSDAT